MNTIPKNCLSCKFLRLTHPEGGLCRVDKSLKPNYPKKDNNYCCARWSDCGQHYFIRLGWIRGQQEHAVTSVNKQ